MIAHLAIIARFPMVQYLGTVAFSAICAYLETVVFSERNAHSEYNAHLALLALSMANQLLAKIVKSCLTLLARLCYNIQKGDK